MVGCDNTFKCCSTASEAELWTCFESRASVISRPYPDSMIESSSFSVCLFNRLFRSLTKDFLLLCLHRYAMALYNQHVCPVNNWYSTHTDTHKHTYRVHFKDHSIGQQFNVASKHQRDTSCISTSGTFPKRRGNFFQIVSSAVTRGHFHRDRFLTVD